MLLKELAKVLEEKHGLSASESMNTLETFVDQYPNTEIDKRILLNAQMTRELIDAMFVSFEAEHPEDKEFLTNARRIVDHLVFQQRHLDTLELPQYQAVFEKIGDTLSHFEKGKRASPLEVQQFFRKLSDYMVKNYGK